jgi:hypothetical protein
LIALSSRFIQTRSIISRSPWVGGNGAFFYINCPIGHRRRQTAQGGLDKAGHVDDGRGHLAPRGARKGEDVVDQPCHLAYAVADNLNQALCFNIQLVGVVLLQRVRKTVDRPQWCWQIVRYRECECLQFLVGGLQFLCTFAKVVIQAEDLGFLRLKMPGRLAPLGRRACLLACPAHRDQRKYR